MTSLARLLSNSTPSPRSRRGSLYLYTTDKGNTSINDTTELYQSFKMTAAILPYSPTPSKKPSRKDRNRMKNQQTGNDNTYIGGDSTGPINSPGSVSTYGNHNTVIVETINTHGERVYNILDTSHKKKFPIPSEGVGFFAFFTAALGFLAEILAIKGEYSNHGSDYADFFISLTNLTAPKTPPSLPGAAAWTLIGIILMVIGFKSFKLFKFLRKMILWIPKKNFKFMPSWAGIKTENGKIYPFAIKLKAKCPKCHDRKLSIARVRNANTWTPLAKCSRSPDHSLIIDVAANNFDEPIER